MPLVTMRELLEAGVHYGHHTSRWNPKMRSYILKRRHSIHVINLRETVRGLVRASRFLSALAEQGGDVILVGTKRQARNTVLEQAARANIHYVAERWLGGTLTNFSIVMSRLRRLRELEELEATGQIVAKGKKLASVLRRELAKLQRNLGGIRNMARLPDAVIIVDPRRERSALREANALSIPAICILDTDSDPDMIDIVIPANDDAMRSVHLLVSRLVDAILEGRARQSMTPEQAEALAIPPAPQPVPAHPAAPAPAEPVPPPPQPQTQTQTPTPPAPEPATPTQPGS